MQSTGQGAQALVLRWQSRVSGTCDGALPFTPLCVLPDFALALTSACSLDPTLAPGVPAAAVPEVLGRTRLPLQDGQAAGKDPVLNDCGP